MNFPVTTLKVLARADIDVSNIAPNLCRVEALVPLTPSEAVAFVYDGEYRYLLLHIVGEKIKVHALPQCVIDELATSFGRHDVQLSLCKVNGQFGVLVCDRAIYLFSKLDESPKRYPIINPFLSPDGDPSRPCVSLSFGQSKDARTPVVFRHHNFLSNRPYFSLLEMDYAAEEARWCHRTDSDLPLSIDYRTRGMDSEIWDVFWTGIDYKVFYIGNSSNYRRYGMSDSSLLSVDVSGTVVGVDLDIEENCFGNIASDHEHLIVTPLYENGERKGKQTVYSLSDRSEYSLKLPRGLAKFKLHDIADDVYWLSNNTRLPQKEILSFVTCAPTTI